MECPQDGTNLVMWGRKAKTEYLGREVWYWTVSYICPECKIEISTMEQVAADQDAIYKAYRKLDK